MPKVSWSTPLVDVAEVADVAAAHVRSVFVTVMPVGWTSADLRAAFGVFGDIEVRRWWWRRKELMTSSRRQTSEVDTS